MRRTNPFELADEKNEEIIYKWTRRIRPRMKAHNTTHMHGKTNRVALAVEMYTHWRGVSNY